MLICEWGPLAFVVPGAWVFATILLERRDAGAFTKHWTVVSGLLVAAGLAAIYTMASHSRPPVFPGGGE